MALLTQEELELETYAFGMKRMQDSIENNETHDRAHTNPYAQAIYRRFVLPLAERIKLDIENATKVPGRHAAHVVLLRGVDADAVAFVAVRAALTSLLASGQRWDEAGGTGRVTVTEVGRSVYHEHLLTQFADAEPTLFYHLLNDMDRRLSSNEQYRMTVMKMQARKNGVEFKEWSSGDRDQVGSYLVGQMSELGMLNTSVENIRDSLGRTKTCVLVVLTDTCRDLIKQISEFVIENTPYFLPCVEPPRDWETIDNGGFHTKEMRRMMPWMVRSHASIRDNYLLADMRHEMACINALQRVRWRINSKMLDHVSNIAKHFDMEEIIAQAELPKPTKPIWLEKGMTKETMSESQAGEFRKWKREVAEWHTNEKVRGTKSGRFINAVRVARKFKDYSAIHFVWFEDFRGRKYALTTGVSPQGSDLQKALLEFADGKPLLTDDAKRWFKITGANRWGYDKETYDDRVKWVEQHHDNIMSFAIDPVSNDEWRQASKPLQFLAWCVEYADWMSRGDRYRSRIAVGMDGSCNGLQNFSAMLRDTEGGVATNLVESDKPKDIYRMVSDLATAILEAEEDDADGFRRLWLDHGLTRELVKRSVMTLPYGSRRTSCAEFIVGDYLKAGKFPSLDKRMYDRAAKFLSYRVWAAIGGVVVKAREAMDWLQNSSTSILNSGYDEIKWITPSGFPACQVYWETTEHRINSKLCGNTKISLRKDTTDPKKSRHRNGIAPNFVHSLDASHLTLVVNACTARGINALAMIHDDYGTHAADAQELYEIIRERFVWMYQTHDVLAAFHTAYPMLKPPPAMGDLDLQKVLTSPYFFG
jgi:DNA-directed RNA polymerase